MGIFINGRQLGVARNGVFNSHNTDPIPGGRLWPEAALTWNAMRADYIAHGGNPGDFMPAGPNSSARSIEAQQHFYYLFQHGGNTAAVPGTSNHGWGIAVDVISRLAAAWLLIHGEKYGWSHDEGARVGEWWHFRLIGCPPAMLKKLRQNADPLAHYTLSEQKWIHQYDHLVHTQPHSRRVAVLRREMVQQRKRIWLAAQPKKRGGDGKGWTPLRKKRYHSLKVRTA